MSDSVRLGAAVPLRFIFSKMSAFIFTSSSLKMDTYCGNTQQFAHLQKFSLNFEVHCCVNLLHPSITVLVPLWFSLLLSFKCFSNFANDYFSGFFEFEIPRSICTWRKWLKYRD